MNAPREVRPKRLARELDLDRAHPSRAEFLQHYVRSLAAHGFPRELANARRNAVSWLLSTTRKSPHEITRADFEHFLAAAKSGGAREPRCAALRRAVASAFDDLCGRPIVRVHAQSTPEERAERRKKRRGRLLTVLVHRVGVAPRDVAALRWTDVDFTRGRVVVTTNEGLGRKSVPIPPSARAALLSARRRARYPDGYLFPSRRGGHTSERALRAELDAVAASRTTEPLPSPKPAEPVASAARPAEAAPRPVERATKRGSSRGVGARRDG